MFFTTPQGHPNAIAGALAQFMSPLQTWGLVRLRPAPESPPKKRDRRFAPLPMQKSGWYGQGNGLPSRTNGN